MNYLDHAATSFPKLPEVQRAVLRAMLTCANPGRGGYGAAREADRRVFACRERAADLFGCQPQQVVFTVNCTQGLNMAIRSLVRPGDRVLISGFEHNAVVRPLTALGAKLRIAGRKLFSWEDTVASFRKELEAGVDAAVFTHVSNVFGYILPVEQLARLCGEYNVPFILDAAQSAGSLPVSLEELGARFIAMPGHKGLLGPQGTGLLLCADGGEPLLFGGTGGNSLSRQMPEDLPERLEAGTLNVPGIAGLEAGLRYIQRTGLRKIRERETVHLEECIRGLQKQGFPVFTGDHQQGAVSFLPPGDCEETAALLAREGIGVRAGLHCAPLAHESAGTLETGTVRLSVGCTTSARQTQAFVRGISKIPRVFK